MTNIQLYLAVGVPFLASLALINIALALVLFIHLGGRIEALLRRK